MKNVVFFDIDGTIVDSGRGNQEMTLPVKKAIRGLQKQGDYVFIATGRPYAFLHRSILEFEFDGYILANGAQIMTKNCTIYKGAMEKEFVRDITAKFEENKIQYILEGEHYSYLKSECRQFYQFYHEFGVSTELVQGTYHTDDVDVLKIEMMCLSSDAKRSALKIIQQYDGYDYFHSMNQTIFELYAKKNSKAAAIKTVMEYLGIPMEYSYAFGDGKNDIEMLSVAGCGIAMENASDEVKQYADVVTKAVNQDGVVVGIHDYILRD